MAISFNSCYISIIHFTYVSSYVILIALSMSFTLYEYNYVIFYLTSLLFIIGIFLFISAYITGHQ